MSSNATTMTTANEEPSVTTTMKEIPFLRHHDLIPLSSSSSSSIDSGSSSNSAAATNNTSPTRGGGGGGDGSTARKRYVASLITRSSSSSGDGESNSVPMGGYGIQLDCVNSSTDRGGGSSSSSSRDDSRALALLPTANDRHGIDDVAGTPVNYSRHHTPNNHNSDNNNNNMTSYNIMIDPHEEAYQLRGLTSVHYSSMDNNVICTNGVAGKRGCVVISVRNAGGNSTNRSGGGGGGGAKNVEVDLSPLFATIRPGGTKNDVLFDAPVGTACFVRRQPHDDDVDETMRGYDASTKDVNGRSYLHLHAVDPFGSVLKLSFTYPELEPICATTSSTSSSNSSNSNNNTPCYLLPLSPPQPNLYPHPGSLVEVNQVCFPTPTTIVFALMPHLYCVDLGDNHAGENGHGDHGGGGDNNGNGGNGQTPTQNGNKRKCTTVTRVWTNTHRVVSDPIAEYGAAVGSNPNAKATPRKKSRQSLGNILTRATYTLVGVAVTGDEDLEEEYEYDEEGNGIGGGGSIMSPIAALTSLNSLLPSNVDGDGQYDGSLRVARVASLHSDGSLRIWVAEPSKKRNKPALRSLWEQDESDDEDEGDGMEFSKKGNENGYSPRLRIPSVQRIASQSMHGIVIDPPIPHPSTWDPCRDSIALRGLCHSALSSGEDSYELALYVQCFPAERARGNDDGNGSVYVFQGSIVNPRNVDNDAIGVCSSDSVLELTLPKGAQSVVDLSWNLGTNGRDLLVLFRHLKPASLAQNRSGESDSTAFYGNEMEYEGEGLVDIKTTLAVYPLNDKVTSPVIPSNLTLPFLDLNHSTHLHELTVEEELNRFLCPFQNEKEDDVANAEAQVDKAGLFAILHPIGRPRPAALAVLRAMSLLKLIDGPKKEVRPIDIVLAMRKWRKRDAFGFSPAISSVPGNAIVVRDQDVGEDMISSPMPTSKHSSIYHAFASATKTPTRRNVGSVQARATPRVSDDEDDDNFGADKSGPIDASAAKQAHKLRWMKLLSEIRRQEAALDNVLCMSSTPLSSSSTNILARGSMMSLFSLDNSPAPKATLSQQDRILAGLDELSLDLLAFVMETPDYRDALCQMGSIIYDAASKASSLISGWREREPENALSRQAGFLGRSALAKLGLGNDQLVQLLNDLSHLDISSAEAWLQTPSSSSSLVRKRLAILEKSSLSTHSAEDYCGKDVRSSAVSLIISQLGSTRQLFLCRLLLVFGLPQVNTSPIHHCALRSVLYSTALSWAVNQPSRSEHTLTVLEENISHVTTGLDLTISGMSVALLLAKKFIESAFSRNPVESLLDIVSPSHDSRVALRLLAPLTEYPFQSSPAGLQMLYTLNQKMNEVTAECLLMEAAAVGKHDSSGAKATALWDLASQLLLDSIPMESIDHSHFFEIFDGLKDSRDRWWSFPSEPHHDDLLFRVLKLILASGDNDGAPSHLPETQDEIKRLCTMQTMKALFLPLAISSSEHGVSMDASFIDWVLSNISFNISVTRLALYQFVKTMMKISNLIHRLTTLERYLNLMMNDQSSLTPCCNVVLKASLDTIAAISSYLPTQLTKEMPEIPTLWSMAFQISMRGSLWDEALQACVSNPLEERKTQNLKRFVLGLVDAGALGKLVDMSLTVVGNDTSSTLLDDLIMDEDDHTEPMTDVAGTNNGIDLFDLSAKIIEEAAFEQSAVSLATHDDSNADAGPNYWGCLYTLHTSRGNWKQAAQAMNMCGTVTFASVSAKSASGRTHVLSKGSSKKAMDDVSLSTQACSNAISLIDKSSHRYILQGQQGNASSTAFFRKEANSSSALEVLTEEDIELRAAQVLALRVLHTDEFSPHSVSSIFKSPPRDVIDALARLGYYDQAIIVALGLSSKSRSCPSGVDLFEDSLKYILREYLVPAATKNCRNSSKVDNADDNVEMLLSRPTIAQIRLSSSACALGSVDMPDYSQVSSASVNSMSWCTNKQCDEVVQTTMAMNLLQQYVTVYSKRCRGLALSVARAILRSAGGTSDLPRWLKDLCMFGTPAAGDLSVYGSFAQQRCKGTDNSRDNADPAGLIRVFMEYGKYEEACSVVISIFSVTFAQADASSRLPEKGSIDYVPYDLIDNLWNSIERIVRKTPSESGARKDEILSLLQCRGRMEDALKNHFESLKTSEEGLQSARALSHA